MKLLKPIAKLSGNKIIATPLNDKRDILECIFSARIQPIMVNCRTTELQKKLIRKYMSLKQWSGKELANNFAKHKTKIEHYEKNK